MLHVYNLARYSSLATATGLTEILPGLRQVAVVPVPGLSASSLLAQLGPLQGRVGLVVDAPGREHMVLQQFHATGLFDHLAGIDLVCGDEPNYTGAQPRAALQSWLEEAGFALTEQDLSDPDWPRLSFRIDQKARQIDTLTAELAALRDLLQQSHATSADTIARLQTEHDRRAAQTNDLTTRLAAADQAIADLTATASQDAAALAEAATRADDLQAALDTATTHHETLTAQVAERDQIVADQLASTERLSRNLQDAKSIAGARADRLGKRPIRSHRRT